MGDSILRDVSSSENIKVDCWPGRKLEQLATDLKEPKRYDLKSYEVVIVHGGTNDLARKSVESMMHFVRSLVESYRSKYSGHIGFSCIIPRPRDESTTGARLE